MKNWQIAVLGVVGFVVLVIILMGVMPMYSVYSQRLAGEAELAKANYSKQVAVQEAQAKMDAAKMLAQAEVERAKGVAQANILIGDSLKNNEAYLRYLFVNNLENTHDQVIYVPTEANLPILEAGRHPK
ncbi:stomatin-like protein [Caudoviricetes sp.]|nr:stomatin-like protein [Caudoviricetes sp.]